MQDKDFDLDIDSILAEFVSDEDVADVHEDIPAQEAVQDSEETVSEPAEESIEETEEPEEHPEIISEQISEPAQYVETRPESEWVNPFSSDSDATAVYTPVQEDKITHFADRYKKEAEEKRLEKERRVAAMKKPAETVKNAISGQAQKLRKDLKDSKNREKAPGKPKKEKESKPPREPIMASVPEWLVITAGVILTLACLMFGMINIHPTSGSSSSLKSSGAVSDASAAVNTFASSSAKAVAIAKQEAAEQAAALAEAQAAALAAAKPHYTIAETDLVAPSPEAACYGSVMPGNAAEVLNVIQKARDSGLLDGQDVVFNENISFRSDTAIRYYLDDTILAICWKEIIDGNTCSCAEVKVADASQFRRKFADDAFGATRQYYATELAQSVNAVMAMNADFYQFRDFGIVVYDRELYRYNDSTYTGNYKKYNCVDTCFITGDGDLLYFKKGEEISEEALRQYIADNNIVFSISFGPVIVENGEALSIDWYPVGEINTGYSRAGLGQKDRLHYFYMSLNHSNDKAARWDINTFAGHFAEKGVESAYAFDGGQTSEIVFQNEVYNYIDFGAERQVSDIIYFATAIPSGEVNR